MTAGIPPMPVSCRSMDLPRVYKKIPPSRSKEARSVYNKKYYAEHTEEMRAKQRAWYKEWKAEYREKIFGEVLSPVCECCGEANKLFLTIDHVNNDGAEDRKRNHRAGIVLGSRLFRKNVDLSRYQTLCYNCNCGRQSSPVKGVCPHKLPAQPAKEIENG